LTNGRNAMAAPFQLLVDVLLEKANYEVTNSNTNAQTFLQSVVLADYTSMRNTGGAQIVSVSVNGKTTTLQIPSGSWTASEVTSAAMYALQLLRAGFYATTDRVKGIHV
jgi:hypothetical protein